MPSVLFSLRRDFYSFFYIHIFFFLLFFLGGGEFNEPHFTTWITYVRKILIKFIFNLPAEVYFGVSWFVKGIIVANEQFNKERRKKKFCYKFSWTSPKFKNYFAVPDKRKMSQLLNFFYLLMPSLREYQKKAYNFSWNNTIQKLKKYSYRNGGM